MYIFHSNDSGNYRVYYRKKRKLYCWQNDGSHGVDKFVFYACSSDGEPEYPIRTPEPHEFNIHVLPDSIKAQKP